MSISSRMLIITLVYIIAVEIFLLLFGGALIRRQIMQEHIDDAALVARTLLTNPNPEIDERQRAALLEDAEILDLVIRRSGRRERLLIPISPFRVNDQIDLTEVRYVEIFFQSLACYFGDNREIMLLQGVVHNELEGIEAMVSNEALCKDQNALMRTSIPFLLMASLCVGLMMYLTVRAWLVRPIQFIARVAREFHSADKKQTLVESRRSTKEFRDLEISMRNMQLRVTDSFKQKQRLATIGESVSKIQHDLRNMLSTAQLLADSYENSEDPRVKRSAPRLLRAIDRGLELSQQTLEYGRLGQELVNVEPVNLFPIVDDVVFNESLHCKGKTTSLGHNCFEHFTVLADARLLKRVLENLLRNARQILEEVGGGQVNVELDPKNTFSIWVKDTGPGLSETAQKHLFEPFKGSSRAGGTGLGLVICKELCRMMGGDLSLEYTGNEGTSFRIDLPKSIENGLAKLDDKI